jgi:protein-tyrosine-phosphatase
VGVLQRPVADVDLSDRQPREIPSAALADCDVVATMGCSTLELDADVDVRDWALEDPHGRSAERVREIRDDVERRVEGLFDEHLGERETPASDVG